MPTSLVAIDGIVVPQTLEATFVETWVIQVNAEDILKVVIPRAITVMTTHIQLRLHVHPTHIMTGFHRANAIMDML